MSSAEPPGPPDDPYGTGAVPVGPEPEPTGAGGSGSGGWGEARTEPFAVAALVWAVVSIVLPVVGTIVAFVLAARAADSIRRSQGTRTGAGLVTAARVVAGVVIVVWAIGLITFLVVRAGDDDTSNVAVPTQPSTTSTSLAPSTTTTTPPSTSSTTLPPPPTTQPIAPTTSIVPPPPTEPTVAPTQPTSPPTTAPPTTAPPTTAPPTTAPPTTAPPTTAPPTTTKPPPSTTSPAQGEETRIQDQLLKTTGNPNRRIGPSNRDVPDDARIVVSYVPGETLQVRWAIDDGAPPLPTGEATCTSPPTTTTTTTLPDGETTTTTTTTTLPDGETTTTTTVPPGPLTTALLARREARTIINVLGAEIRAGRLDVDGVQLVGTYPIAGADTDDVDVVQVFYTNADVDDSWPYTEAFSAPPAAQVQCLNPAFD